MSIYAPFISPSPHETHLLMMKAADTDPTVDANWAVIGNPIHMWLAFKLTSIWAYQDGTDIHVVTAQENDRIAYHVFSTSSDTWTTTDEEVVLPTNAASVRSVSIAVRSDGDVIVLYSESDGTLIRVRYARKESGTWTTGIQVDNGGAGNWHGAVIVRGSNDRMHFFFKNDTNNDAYQRTLTSANVLETFPSAGDTSVSGINHLFGPGISYDDGETQRIRCPYMDNTDRISYAEFDSADAPGAFTINASVSDNLVADILNSLIACLAVNGTDEHLLYSEDVTLDIFHNDNGAADVEVNDAVTANRLSSNVYVRSSTTRLAYLYLDASTIKYDEVDLAGGTVFQLTAVVLGKSVSDALVRADTRLTATSQGISSTQNLISRTTFFQSIVQSLSQANAAISRKKAMQAASNALSRISSAIQRTIRYDAAAHGSSKVNSEIDRETRFVAEVNAASQVDSNVARNTSLESVIGALSAANVQISRKRSLNSAIHALSNVRAQASRTAVFNSAINALSSADSIIVRNTSLESIVEALSKVDSRITRTISLESVVSALSQVDSNISRTILFDSVVEALSSTDAQLSLTAAFTALEGTIDALSDTNANLIRTVAMASVVDAQSKADAQVANLTSLSSIIEALSSVDAQATRTAVLTASVDAFSKIDSRIERTTVLESVVQSLSKTDAKVSRRTTLESVVHATSSTRSGMSRVIRFLSTSVGLAKSSALLDKFTKLQISGRVVGRSIVNGGISLVARIAGVVDAIAKTQSQTSIIARMVGTSQGASRVVEADGGFTVIIEEEIVAVVGGGGLDYGRERRIKHWKEQEEKRRKAKEAQEQEELQQEEMQQEEMQQEELQQEVYKKITATVFVEGIKYVESIMTKDLTLNLDDVYISVEVDKEVGVSIMITLPDGYDEE